MSAAQVARAIGMHPRSVRMWISRGWRPLDPEARREVAELLGVEPEFLWPERQP